MQFLYHVTNKHEFHPLPVLELCAYLRSLYVVFFNIMEVPPPSLALSFFPQTKRTCLKAQQLQTGSEEDRLQMGP
jgi:hypothetical protein